MRAPTSPAFALIPLALAGLAFGAAAPAARAVPAAGAGGSITLSIVSTTDIHGFVWPVRDRGSLALFAGYVNNLRAARAADGGAVLLVDAGDTYQGGVESNLSEGALLVDAFNAMGYAAAAIGNHEFDFGALDGPGAREDPAADPQGAIKARAAQARYPMLAANLLDAATGRRVEWPNVRPSTLIELAGIKVGLVGVMTATGLRSTIAANVVGLDLAPMASTIASEAKSLRSAGANLVVVVAHGGGGCSRFDDPTDLSSCEQDSEIFQVARALPSGLVNVIAAGHTHDAVAHVVNGIAIVQAYPLGRAFARADVAIDSDTHRVTNVRPFPPREICAYQRPDSAACEDAASRAPLARYEGRTVQRDQAIVDAMAPALARVRRIQAARLGVVLDAPLQRTGGHESALGNLFADALRGGTGADVALSSSVRGMRADLAAGPLTFGALYDVFPFDNRLRRVQLTGAGLRRLAADQIATGRTGTFGVSGVRIQTECDSDGIRAAIARPNGVSVRDEEMLTLVTVEPPVPGPVFASLQPPERRDASAAPLVREIVEDWLRSRSGRLRREEFSDARQPRWNHSQMAGTCLAR